MKKIISTLLTAATVILICGMTNAQVMLQKAAISSGGGVASNATTKAGITVAQTVTGTASNSKMNAEYGFWTTDAAHSGVSAVPNTQLGIEIWPNPVSGNATANITLANASYLDVRLFDINGKEVKSIFSGVASTGILSIEIDLSGMASGSYILAARIPGQVVERGISVIR